MSWRTEMSRLARKSLAELEAISTELLHRPQTPYVRRRQQQVTYAIANLLNHDRHVGGAPVMESIMDDKSYTDQALLNLAARIGAYMGQEAWPAFPHHSSARLVDPARPDFAVVLRNTWPRGRVEADGGNIEYKDGGYHYSWSCRGIEITFDPARPPQAIAGDIKRRLLPELEKQYAANCRYREEFKATVARCNSLLAYLNDLREKYDQEKRPLEERDVPANGTSKIYLSIEGLSVSIDVCSGEIRYCTVTCDRDFLERIVELHLNGPIWGHWRILERANSSPRQPHPLRIPQGSSIEHELQRLAVQHIGQFGAEFYELQYKQLNGEWQTYSYGKLAPEPVAASAQTVT